MLLAAYERLVWGEPVDEDEALCPVHGARLLLAFPPAGCYACHEDDDEPEEDEAEARFNEWAGSQCRYLQGKGFAAFGCRMPMWA